MEKNTNIVTKRLNVYKYIVLFYEFYNNKYLIDLFKINFHISFASIVIIMVKQLQDIRR